MPRKGEVQSPATKAATRVNSAEYSKRARRAYEAQEYRDPTFGYRVDNSCPADILAAFKESEND